MSRFEQGMLGFVLVLTAVGPAQAWQSAKKAAKAQSVADPVLVIVNGDKITESDLIRRMKTRQVPEDERDRYREAYLEKLIDSRLIQQFLTSRKTAATKQEIDEQIKLV